MTNNTPLTDEDRWDWLISLRKAAVEILAMSKYEGVVVACSALKQKCRDVMRVAAYGSPSVQIHFMYLRLAGHVLVQRVDRRQSHYMKSDMVHSQLQVLEEPLEEEWDVVTVDVDASPETVPKRVSLLVSRILSC